MIIQQYGLPRSGTNYIETLLAYNFDVVVINKEKHGYAQRRDLPTIVTCKNIHSWLVSCHRYYTRGRQPEHRTPKYKDFKQFIRSELVLIFIDKHTSILSFVNPVQCWNVMNRHWLALSMLTTSYMVRYESLVESFDSFSATLEDIGRFYPLKRKNDEWLNTLDRVGGEREVPQPPVFDRSYYNERRYMLNFDTLDLAFVKEQVDNKLLLELGYEQPEPTKVFL